MTETAEKDDGGPIVEVGMGHARTWQLTHRLRWLVPDGTYTSRPVLQQASQCLETGELEWSSVPTVTHSEARKQGGVE